MNLKNHLITGIIFVCCGLFFSACERDDLCSSTYQVTPNLIIEFYDTSEPETHKPVANFGFVAVGSTDTIFLNNVSEISLPLRTNQNNTTYLLTINTTNETTINTDEIRFDYAISDEYVNRSCGFRTVFLDFQAIRISAQAQETNWIQNLSVKQSNIRDENEAHLYIFH